MIPQDKLLWVYRKMQQIRQFEETVKELFAKGEIPGFLHLYAGEEAVAVGVCAHLSDQDCITSSHRGHGHCIAKGSDINKIMAELFGRTTGLCKGKGGSMHVADLSVGNLGANPIVGGGIPHAVGAALAAKYRKTDNIAVCFMGDGATNQGTCHESMNLASIWKLPVLFLIENNRYAQSTPQEYHQPTEDIYIRAAAYGMPGDKVDGMDVFAVYDKVEEMIKGGLPAVLEAKTYRFFGHFEGDSMSYRTREEMDRYRKEQDCLVKFRERVVADGLLEESALVEVEKEVADEIAGAVKFAKESPLPKPEAALEDVYVYYGKGR